MWFGYSYVLKKCDDIVIVKLGKGLGVVVIVVEC